MSRLRDQLGCWVYPAHRLDRGTSGVLLFALDPEAAAKLAHAFERRCVRKSYLAVVRGFAPEAGTVDHPLREGKTGPAPAVTAFARLATAEISRAVGRYPTSRYSLVRAEPLTGRRHQIRRHLKHVSHPIVGDSIHGDGRHNSSVRQLTGVSRLLLHSRKLELVHPETLAPLSLEAPLPAEMAAAIERLGLGAPLPRLSQASR